ncbi:MAG: hypothetical protein KJ767_04255 [Nanoarchaeota archaeon]|nr:hypothetical protein [Nanoarchaeota archaeon]
MEEKVNIREKIKEGGVRAILIIEVLGKPSEHVREALKQVLRVMEEDKHVDVLSKKRFKPKKVKGTKDLFTAFMEIEILAKNFLKLFEVCYDYMPSSIEIIEPSDLKMPLSNANEVINDLASRLHQYDSVTKKISIENQILQNKLNSLLSGNPIIENEELVTKLGKDEVGEQEKEGQDDEEQDNEERGEEERLESEEDKK